MVYIVAEIGCNHNGSVELARKMIDEAVACGVDAVKFQTFKSELLISKVAPKADYQKITTGENDTQLEMTKRLELSFDDYLSLKAHAISNGVDVFSTPFDMTSLNFLIKTNMSIYKIPSGEITNLPFLEKIGEQKKSVWLSTGMATLEEIRYAVSVLQRNGTQDITILHCTTEYPAPYESLNLNVLTTLKQEFPQLKIGYSDHSIGCEAAIASVALGAEVIEKHFTLDQNMPGPDHKASATPKILRELVMGVRNIEKALGSSVKQPDVVEVKNMIVARKSLIAKRLIKKGEKFSEENIIAKRPGNGISPIYWYDIMGHIAEYDIEEDSVIQHSLFPNQYSKKVMK